MKFSKLFLTFALSLFLLYAVSAEANVTYNVYSGTLNNDGTVTYSSNPIVNFRTVGYICSSASCSSVSSYLFTQQMVAGSTVKIPYPTVLQSVNGYGVYFYKHGYIHWEVAANWAGNGELAEPRNVYLLKKESCYAPILSLSVLNEVNPHKLIEIGVTAGIDAETYSAIRNAGPLNYQPVELSPFTNVNTTITLEIRNSQDQIVHTETKQVLIPYSSSVDVSFTHNFTSTGDYSVRVYSDVSDAKCLASVRQSANSQVRVINPGMTNYSYAIIDNFGFEPQFINIGDNVEFQFEGIANFVDNFGVLNPINATAYVTFYRNDVAVDSFNYGFSSLNATDFTLSNFNRVFAISGDYIVNLRLVPQSFGNETISAEQNLTFTILASSQNETNSTVPIITIISPVNGASYDTRNLVLNATANQVITSWFYSLNSGVNTSFVPGSTIGFLEGTNNLVVYGANLNGTGSVSISFNVDLDDDDDDDDDDNDNDNDKEDDFGNFYDAGFPCNSTIYLTTKPAESTFRAALRKLIYWLLIFILVVLIAIVSVYIVKYLD